MARKFLFALVAVAFAGWYYATPYLAFNGMKEAADKGDAQALSAYVDYPALRDNLKASLKGRTGGGDRQPGEGNPIAAFGARLLGAAIDTVVDAMVTPDALALLLRGEKPAAGEAPRRPPATQPPPSSPDNEEKKAERQTIVDKGYTGWNRFTVRAYKKDSPQRQVVLDFERRGLAGWQLVAIDLTSR